MRIESSSDPIVVVEGGRFTWCPADRNQSVVVSLSELLAHLGADGGLAASARRDPVSVGPIDVVVHPRRAVATVARDGALHAYLDLQQRWVELGPEHLALVDRLDGGVSIDDLSEHFGLRAEVVRSLVEDLLAVGAAYTVPVGFDTVDVPAPVPASEQPEATAPPAVEPASGPPRVPVYSFWATPEGPHMGGAAVVAYARAHAGGRLNEAYDLRKVRTETDVLDEIERSSGPAVLLCSDYLWSLERNLEVAARAVALNSEIVVIHGGPSAPRSARECERFLADLPGDNVVVRGEGEVSFAEALLHLAGLDHADGGGPGLDVRRLAGVAGVSYFDRTTCEVVVGEDRPRHSDLSEFPSALLSGEFDFVPLEVIQRVSVPVETVRGCPYGCTFCDWGQATMSRIRTFPEERFLGEFEWLAEHEVSFWVIADANWGMLPRDLAMAQAIADLHRRTGYPHFVGAGPPKNSTDRYVAIVDTLLSGGVSLKAAIALQSRDQATLDAVHRSNIKTSTYDRIVAAMRARDLPLHCELMLGLPGSTIESLKTDLQWCVDENIRPHVYQTFVLPNAPMNDPDYRAEHQIQIESGVVVATSSYSLEEGARMYRVAYAYQALEFFGLLRYVLRYLQWDHGRPALDVVQEVVDLTDAEPHAFPLVSFVLRHFDEFIVPPVGWAPFFDELHRLVVQRLGVADDAGLKTAFEVTRQVVPWPDRAAPYRVALEHDFVAYFAANNLTDDRDPARVTRPLESYPPGTLEVLDDPEGVASGGFGRSKEADTAVFPGFVTAFWEVSHLELLSALTVYQPMSHEFVEAARRLVEPSGAVDVPGSPVVIDRRV